MADWLTHTLIGWVTGKVTKQTAALVVIGALIPDLSKINLAFVWLGIQDIHILEPLHTPLGALLIAGIITLFFQHMKKTFLALSLGVSTHFIIDFFLVHTHGGMKLLFPISWEEWQVYIYRSDDYRVTIIALLVAFFVYAMYWVHGKRTKTSPQKNNMN